MNENYRNKAHAPDQVIGNAPLVVGSAGGRFDSGAGLSVNPELVSFRQFSAAVLGKDSV